MKITGLAGTGIEPTTKTFVIVFKTDGDDLNLPIPPHVAEALIPHLQKDMTEYWKQEGKPNRATQVAQAGVAFHPVLGGVTLKFVTSQNVETGWILPIPLAEPLARKILEECEQGPTRGLGSA